MPSIEITSATLDRINLLARAWGCSHDDVISRLLHEFQHASSAHPELVAVTGTADDIAVHALYQGHRVNGRFWAQTGRLEITSDPLPGRSFKTPSGAAIAVVQAFNPRVNPNRNGWSFWIVDETGETLQTRRAS